MDNIAKLILRLGLVFVFGYFAVIQFMAPLDWVGYLPAFLGENVNWVYANAVFEAIFSILLLIGIYPRVVAGLLALHLFGITATIGFDALGVRDFGLAVATLSLAMMEPDSFTLAARKKHTKSETLKHKH